jgi:hypothetical protein
MIVKSKFVRLSSVFEKSFESHFMGMKQPKIFPSVSKMTVTVTVTIPVRVRVFA